MSARFTLIVGLALLGDACAPAALSTHAAPPADHATDTALVQRAFAEAVRARLVQDGQQLASLASAAPRIIAWDTRPGATIRVRSCTGFSSAHPLALEIRPSTGGPSVLWIGHNRDGVLLVLPDAETGWQVSPVINGIPDALVPLDPTAYTTGGPSGAYVRTPPIPWGAICPHGPTSAVQVDANLIDATATNLEALAALGDGLEPVRNALAILGDPVRRPDPLLFTLSRLISVERLSSDESPRFRFKFVGKFPDLVLDPAGGPQRSELPLPVGRSTACTGVVTVAGVAVFDRTIQIEFVHMTDGPVTCETTTGPAIVAPLPE